MPLVMTASVEKSWGETNRTLEVKFDEGVDRSGPVPIAFIITEPKKAYGFSDTRVAIFTDADFLSNAYLDFYSNAQMGLNVISWLTEMDYQPVNLAKNMQTYRLDLTSRQKRTVTVWLVVMPVLVILAGFAVWLKHYD